MASRSASEGDLQTTSMMIAALRDEAYEMDGVIVDGDKVVVRWKCSRIRRGGLMGIPPTDRKVMMAAISIYHRADDEVAGSWEHCD